MRFALPAGDHARDFVVIGGLNPDFLAPSAPVPHLGTTDVDLLFELGFIYDRDEQDFAWLDRVLTEGGFTAAQESRWRWDGILGESRVRLDLLCDVPDNPGQAIGLPGAETAVAQNLGGPSAALRTPIVRSLAVSGSTRADFPDAPAEVRLKFASLGGYIVTKSFALLSRGLDKDAYDLMFVILFADGGARSAATAAAEAAAQVQPNRPSSGQVVRDAVTKFTGTDSRLTDAVIRQLVQAGDDSNPDQLRNDVTIAARQFLSAFPTQ